MMEEEGDGAVKLQRVRKRAIRNIPLCHSNGERGVVLLSDMRRRAANYQHFNPELDRKKKETHTSITIPDHEDESIS